MTAASRDGAAALDDARAFIARFCALPVEHAYTAVTLWAAHAWALDAFDSTPRLAFLSPEPGSGKTRALEILTRLVPWPMHAVNATPAALFRSVADPASRRTILFDEIDTIFGPKAKEHEELRGLLNAGHRRSGVAYRCVGEGTRQEVAAFPAYAAVALAGLGQLPDTILTRSVVIRMRRRAPHEYVEPYRARIHEPEGKKLGQQLGDWANSAAERMTGAWPDMPPGVTDRPADVWEPLLTVADAAGGPWPARARAACSWLVRDNADRGISLGIRLLADLRGVFDGQAALNTADILARLHDLDDGPWADLKGQPLDARGLSRLLSPYDIAPVKVRAGGTGRPLMGYRAEHLADAWARYLPPPADDPACSGCSGTPAEQRNTENPLWPAEVPHVPDVPDLQPKDQTPPRRTTAKPSAGPTHGGMTVGPYARSARSAHGGRGRRNSPCKGKLAGKASSRPQDSLYHARRFLPLHGDSPSGNRSD
jgi:hypothetical protein